MKHTIMWTIKLGIVASMYIAGWLLFDSLPEIIPTHWNAQGVADGFMYKQKAILLFPSIALAMLGLFYVLPKIDPLKKSYQKFERAWEILQILLMSLFAYFYGVSLYTALSDTSPEMFIVGGIGLLFIALGNYMSKFKRNFFVGIKTPWTLASEIVWNKTHRFGGWCFIAAGALLLLQTLLQTSYGVPVMIFAITVAAILPIVYSAIIHHRLKAKNEL